MLDCQATPSANNHHPRNNHREQEEREQEERRRKRQEEEEEEEEEEENGAPIACKYCQESGERVVVSGDQHQPPAPVYWGIQLDQDLLETLVAIYPDWFKGYDLNLPPPSAMAESGTSPNRLYLPLSPPKAEVDETPIKKTMDRHKESLKVKLLLRRPINQLVDQGIMPPLKTPPAFHEQRQKLERAKMGDILKSKIQRRPDRQELIQQHILEDTNVDPSLHDKQRQLKKARLADDLNERLSHRPGPLELIKGNILKADEEFSRALKDGQIPFKRTCEGETRKHPPPFVFEEDSSSEGAMSPAQESENGQARSPPDVTCYAAIPSPSLGSAVSSLSPLSSVASPASTVAQPPPQPPVTFMANAALLTATATNASPMANATPMTIVSPSTKMMSFTGKSEPGAGKDQNRNRKKSKSKSAPKTRTIKFHEYKGPPNAQKALLANAAQVETSYELLLQQQQLFLQWQLELQHKFPQIILPATQKTSNNSESNSVNGVLSPGQASNSAAGGTPMAPMSPPSSQQDGQSVVRCLSKLEDMKVSDLKAELKKRNLPVSGSKPQLIERLRHYSDTVSSPHSGFNGHSSSGMTNGLCGGAGGDISSGPSSLTFDTTSSQGSPAEDPCTGLHLEGSVVSPPGTLDHDSQEAASNACSPSAIDEATYGATTGGGSPSPFSVPAPPPPTTTPSHPHPPLQRPSSVAPMEVDANSNSAFDPMDVSDIARNLPHLSAVQASLMSVLQMNEANFLANVAPNEEILKKKIEELQRELQRSQYQLQQQQTISQHQHQRQQKAPQSQQQAPPPPSVSAPPPRVPSPSESNVQDVKPTFNNSVENSKSQQKLMLQQHFQQRIQQQQLLQLQQQQQAGGLCDTNSSPTSTNVKASLAAFLQAQAAPNNAASATQPAKVYFNGSTLSPVASSEGSKQRTSSLPNGLGHIRTNSLPNFVGLDAVPQKQPIARTTTDPQFLFAKPPPDYDEATKQLSKHQFAQTLIETLNSPPGGGRKSVKSQAVDDVLEILIKNGELPPSAAQEPPTPPTPKMMQSAIQFPSAVNHGGTGASSSNGLLLPTLNSSSPLVGPNSTGHISLVRENHTPPLLHQARISSPVPPAPTFDLDFSLDLEGLEPMNLEGFTMEGHIHRPHEEEEDDDAFLGTSSMDEHEGGHVNDFVGFEDDGNHMDIDMVEVSEWLDTVLPSNGNGVTILPANGFNNNNNNNNNNHHNASLDCNDPLLSANQGIFNLLNLEDDFRVSHDLVWDKLDFAT